MEGRRHSVDLPISKTLVALRRVRSLRDPSTISSSKFSSLLDNVNWETNSNNGISLRFLEENHVSHHHHNRHHRMIEESNLPWNQKNRSTLGVIPSIDPLEGVESSNEPSLGSLRERIMDRIALRREFEGKSKSENSYTNSNLNSVSVDDEDDDVADDILPDSELAVARSLGQKFRPRSFSELVGQSVVARSLLGAIRKGRVTSLYIFHGPRGTGKSSAARIFAAALNCLEPDSESSSEKPCGFCRECVAFFLGRCRDVREVDSVSIDGRDRIRSLMNEGSAVSSRFKVIIVDECQSLRNETWAAILHGLDDGLSRRIVFVMIAPELEGLPRGALSRSQRYHFPKIKDSEIFGKLANICVEEGFDFERDALEFVASKSGGSMRDAEMMLDQLSLLGRKITVPLAYELVGVVSDSELLDLLDLAMSSDSSRTVIRARELMRSRIDPMQLVSQLANLIMDILAGSQEDCSEVTRKFFSKHASEVELQKLSHALKILSETEKQLRMSKNQTTWLTVALLQLSSLECSPTEANDSKFWIENGHERGEERINHLENCSSEEHKSVESETTEDQRRTLESIWKRTVESCQSPSLRKFLIEQGKLSSLLVSQGVAVAELEFCHPDCVSKAEKSLRQISDSLRSVLGCNVVIRINLVSYASHSMYAKMKSASQRLLGCSRKLPNSSPDCEIENARSVIPLSCDERSSTPENNNNNIPEPVSAKVLSLERPKNRTRCFPRKLRTRKKNPRSSEEQNKLALTITGRASVDENPLREDSELSHCWRTLHLRKAWRSRHQQENSFLARWVSPCSCCAAK